MLSDSSEPRPYMTPIIDFTNPCTLKTHRLWRFPTGYGVSAVNLPSETGENWSVAVVHFPTEDNAEFNIAWDHPLHAESDGIFNDTPENQLMALVELAAAWPKKVSN